MNINTSDKIFSCMGKSIIYVVFIIEFLNANYFCKVVVTLAQFCI